MGIRIKTALGYALTDICNHGNSTSSITDDRINVSRLAELYEDEDFSIAAFADYLRSRSAIDGDPYCERSTILQFLCGFPKGKDLASCFVYDAEFFDPSVLIVIPPTVAKYWYRSDDTIDYYRAQQDGNRQERLTNLLATAGVSDAVIQAALEIADFAPNYDSSLLRLGGGIYPYEQKIDRSTGKMFSLPDLPADLPKAFADSEAIKLGFDSHADYCSRVRYWPPLVVHELCAFAGIFTNLETIWSLVPVQARWWS